MNQDEDKIVIYTNGTTVEAPASVVYIPFPDHPKDCTDEKKE